MLFSYLHRQLYIYIYVFIYIILSSENKHLTMVHTSVLGAPYTSEINGCEKLEQKAVILKNNLNGL